MSVNLVSDLVILSSIVVSIPACHAGDQEDTINGNFDADYDQDSTSNDSFILNKSNDIDTESPLSSSISTKNVIKIKNRSSNPL